MVKVKILFTAEGSREDADMVCNNFSENYPEFAEEMEEEEFSCNEETGEIKILWSGEFEDLSEEDRNELIRLTHHAEGLYEDTDAEYVHVEVCIDETWYGR